MLTRWSFDRFAPLHGEWLVEQILNNSVIPTFINHTYLICSQTIVANTERHSLVSQKSQTFIYLKITQKWQSGFSLSPCDRRESPWEERVARRAERGAAKQRERGFTLRAGVRPGRRHTFLTAQESTQRTRPAKPSSLGGAEGASTMLS